MRVSYHNKSYIRPIQVPGSKSITNRLLILKHLFFDNMHIDNASDSTDSLSLRKSVFNQKDGVTKFHVEDGGTTLRFLICYLARTNTASYVTCGSKLFLRPHDDLITTLNNIGFDIEKTRDGFTLHSVDLANISAQWDVDISKSSQFATALLLIAPSLNKPITLSLNGRPVSIGYFDLTVGLMQDLGCSIKRIENSLTILPMEKNAKTLLATVEADWSSISYFVAIARLSNHSLTIQNVNENSLQPDVNILEFAKMIGIDYAFNDSNLILHPTTPYTYPKEIRRDYTNCPDIALTERVICEALGIEITATGTEHLKYKESNRSEVIEQELSKFDQATPEFLTHNDHRVAMWLTALSIIKPIQLDDISVVSKSFPDFWQEVSKIGIYLTPDNG